jgi:signal transduction histidine kinase
MLLQPSKHAAKAGNIPPAPDKGPGRFGGLPLLSAAFGSLVALMLIAGAATLNKAGELYTSLADLNASYRKSWFSLEEIRSGIHVSSVLVRDYLLDPSQSRTREIRAELLRLRRETELHQTALERDTGEANRANLRELRAEINAYWESLDPVFDWTPEQKHASAYAFLRQRIMPRREAVLSLAEEVQHFTDSTFQQQSEATAQREEEFRRFLRITIGASVALGLLVAMLSLARVGLLEKRSERSRRRTEQAEDELRRLSHQLVHAQEEERRSISRELHDEVGQMLTGLRMDLRSLKRLNGTSRAAFEERVDQSCILLEQTLQSVRDLAMGLRPSMLDDIGLEAALRWQVRQFERRHDIDVTLTVEGDLDHLQDKQSTNLYRIVQEGLTNCARHAKPNAVVIQLKAERGKLKLRIADDGTGMAKGAGAGLGLIGIQERVRELGGSFRISSPDSKGTVLAVDLPQGQAAPNA